MSEQKDFDKYLKGEYYPGAPKTPWRIAMEADFAARGVSFDSRPVPQKRVVTKSAPVAKLRSPRIPKAPKVVPPKAVCKECPNTLRRDNKSGYCEMHWIAKRYEVAHGARPACLTCSAPINRSNDFGLCRAHAMKYYLRRQRAKRKEAA